MHLLNNNSVQTTMQPKTVTQKTLKRKLNSVSSENWWTATSVKNMLTTDTRECIIYDTLVLATTAGRTACYGIADVNGLLPALMKQIHTVPNTHCIVHKFNKKYTQIGILEAALTDTAFVNFTKPLAVAIAKHTIALDKHATKKAKQAVYTANWKAKQAAA
jgi:hypothetical protein